MRLQDLPQTREEVEEIGKIVGPEAVILLGKDATETAFKKEPLDQFRVLHLAVHGFADKQYPERSALVLGTDPKSGDDGLLQVREIIRLRLNAELTTLSACDTGVGKLQGQEGVSSLVEAFLVAGSKSVVASLWSADDTFASALMDRFYQRLGQGEDTGSALRGAKLDLLAKYGEQVSPFYWAAFVAVGETSATDWDQTAMNLTLEERTKIFDKVCRLVETKHFNPSMNGVDWNALVKNRRDQILASAEPETFEKEVQSLVAELKTSHTGFRHAGMRNIPARHAINATMQRIAVNGSERWMFQDVHQGGPAYSAGIRPGDLLLGNGEREIRPPDDLTFSVGESASLLIEKLHGGQQTVKVQLPLPKSKTHPVTAPEAVHAERLSDEIGLLKVAMFPGVIGIDVAKDIDRAIGSLDGCNRLIVDLRGNTGGGIGGLRLMSYLTPGKLEVGYSLTRKRRERGYRREELTRFGRIPSHKATLIWLAARYAFVEKSILVVTEGLGQRRFHGRVVLLVNEHTASAGEMVSAFAEENNLATIVGTKNTRPSTQWQRIQGWPRIHSWPPGCRLSDLARTDAREQWHCAEVFY